MKNEDITRMHPIKLTKEWLLKFGFKLQGVECYHSGWYELNGIQIWYSSEGCTLSVNNEDYGYQVGANCVIKYVNQLQTLYLLLTGNELK